MPRSTKSGSSRPTISSALSSNRWESRSSKTEALVNSETNTGSALIGPPELRHQAGHGRPTALREDMMRIGSMRFAAAMLMAGLLLAAFGNPAQAADFPNKPIQLIVPYAAGGSTDV